MAVEQTGVPDGWEVVDTPHAPTGDAPKTVADQIAIQVASKQAQNAARDQYWPADIASKLPERFRSPVAMGLSMIEPATQIAGVMSAAPGALAAGRAVTSALSKPADVMLDALIKRIGGDPDALELAATKMRLQAARSQTRQAKIAGQINAAAGGGSPAASVVASPPVVAAPPAPMTAGTGAPQSTQAAPPEAPPAVPASLGQALTKVKLSGAEVVEVQRLTQRGMPLPDALALVQQQRALVQRLGLPTTADVRATVATRNASGRWPE